MNDIIREIRQELHINVDEKTRNNSQKFFKEKIKYYGVKTAVVKKIGKQLYKEIKSNSKSEIFYLCEKLWQSGFLEESFIACDWSYYLNSEYEPADFQIFERWIDNYVNNWASCDTLCNHAVGDFIERYPKFLENLKGFTKSDNRWKRRASAVSLIVPARKGKFLSDILEIADLLLTDKDDLVQKGYGWMLKVASQTHRQTIFEYVMKNKMVMPRTALRYAIEKMPADLKSEAMRK